MSTLNHLHFDCFSGISGDMTLGALVDLGVDIGEIEKGLAKLPIGKFALRAERTMRQGIAGTRVHVEVEEEPHTHRHLSDVYAIVDAAGLPPRALARAKRAYLKLAEAEAHVHGTTVENIHFHEVGAKDAIVDICGVMLGLELLGIDSISVGPITVGFGTIQCAHGTMPVPAPATAQLLLGLPQTPGEISGEMVTPTGAAILQALLAESIESTESIPSTKPTIPHDHQHHHHHEPHHHEHTHPAEQQQQHDHSHDHDHDHGHSHSHDHAHDHDHGHGFHEHPHEHEHEHHTHDHAHALPAVSLAELTVARVGYGAGSKDLKGRPNFLRALLCASPAGGAGLSDALQRDTVIQLECEIDDQQPELTGYVMERLLALGALDVQLQPVQMKKHRPGFRLTVLAEAAAESKLAECIFRETSTFGLRRQRIERYKLRREILTVETKLGPVRFKLGYWGDTLIKAAPEFEDCRKIAEKNGLPLTDVYAKARHAYEHVKK